MIKPTRSKIWMAVAFVIIIAAVIIAVSEWRVRHNPTGTRGWPIDIYVSGYGGNMLTMRNTYGINLYYTNGFRIYRHEADVWELVYTQPGEHVRLIRPNTIRNSFVEWDSSSNPDGQYRFAKDFFLTPGSTTVYKTLLADFEIIRGQAWLDLLTHYALEGGVSPWRKDYIEFVTAGASSRAIVPAGRVQVSRTAIAFTSRNRSLRVFSHGNEWELAHYINGVWQPVPHSPSEVFRLPFASGFGVIPRTWRLDTIQLHIMHGELPPGQYLFIRRYSRNFDDSAGRYFDYDYMMFTFVICENTPVYLPRLARGRALASAIVSGVIVHIGFILAFALLLIFFKRIYKGTRDKRG